MKPRMLLSVAILTLLTVALQGGPFDVNQTTSGDYTQCAVAVQHLSGDYVVTWINTHDGKAYFRLFDRYVPLTGDIPAFPAFAVGGSWTAVDVTMTSIEGTSEALWVIVGVFEADGGSAIVAAAIYSMQHNAPHLESFQFRGLATDIAHPRLVMNDKTEYVIVFQMGQDVFAAGGVYGLTEEDSYTTPVVHVNEYGPAVWPEVAINEDGEGLIVWEDPADEAIRGRVIDRNIPFPYLDAEFTITDPYEAGYHPDVAINDEGKAVIAWTNWEHEINLSYFWYPLGDAAETLAMPRDEDDTDKDFPAVAISLEGDIWVTWQRGYDGAAFIEGQRCFWPGFQSGPVAEFERRLLQNDLFLDSGESACLDVDMSDAGMAVGGMEVIVWSCRNNDGDRDIEGQKTPIVYLEPEQPFPADTRSGATESGVIAIVPNPFNPTGIIRYHLAQAGAVRLVVYDLLGKTVCSLADGWLEAGDHQAQWNGRSDAGVPVASGMYLLRLESRTREPVGTMHQTRKLFLIR